MIIIAETTAHVDEKYIVGFANKKDEIFSVLFDFYNYLNINNTKNNYEENWIMFDISIYHLNNEDYIIIKEILEKYEEEIETWRENILTNKNIENFYNNLLLIPIKTDGGEINEKNFINFHDRNILIKTLSRLDKFL